jgi:hypothetical protein
LYENLFVKIKSCFCVFIVKANNAMEGKDFVAKKLKIRLKHDTSNLENMRL